jgi:LacI family transcriptional regulator
MRNQGQRLVRGTDVARAAGVSVATVSLVLNDRRNVVLSERTRDRVREAARRLGYLPNRVAQSLIQGRTRTVGVLLPSLASSFVARIADGIETAAAAAGLGLLLANSRHDPESEDRQLGILLGQRVEGVVLVAGEGTVSTLGKRLERLQQSATPFVVVDDETHGHRGDCVVSDDRQGMDLAVAHLASLGHRRIAHLGAGSITSSALARLDGYRAAMARLRLRVDRDWIEGDAFRSADPAASLMRLLRARRPPTAVVAANDRHLAEALPTLRAAGIGVPGDLSLVGYANYDFASYLDLTSVEQDPEVIGAKAFGQLLSRITDGPSKPARIRVPVRLIVRSSTQAAFFRS